MEPVDCSDLNNDLDFAFVVHFQLVSSSTVMAHMPALDSVTAHSVESDGVYLTGNTPKKAILPIDG